MSIRGIVFDTGGVLEITPDLGVMSKWGHKLGLQPGEVIFLDDSAVAVDAARAFGIHGMFFKGAAQAMANIQACIQANTS